MTKKQKNKIEEDKIDISHFSRDEKIKALIDYAKECYTFGNKPTKRSIRQKFNVEIYNYFENIGDYYKKSDIPLNLQDYPGDEAKKMIIEFVKHKAESEVYLSKRDIENELKIHIDTYFKDLKNLYEIANIDYSIVQNAIMQKMIASHTYTSLEVKQQKQAIRNFIQKNVSEGFYPSTQHIQKSLNLAFYTIYNDIYEAYQDANVKYERPSPILLGKRKEKVLTLIIKDLFYRMDYKIKRVSIESKIDFNKYADMTIFDKEGNKILVEIKAYRKDYSITKREFNQLLGYMKKENISKGIFITTSNKCKLNSENIKFIDGDRLIELLKKYNLHEYLYSIKWIQESRVNSKEKEVHYNLMRNKILEYVKSKKEFPSKKELEKFLRLDIKTYFGKKPYQKIKELIKNKKEIS